MVEFQITFDCIDNRCRPLMARDEYRYPAIHSLVSDRGMQGIYAHLDSARTTDN